MVLGNALPVVAKGDVTYTVEFYKFSPDYYGNYSDHEDKWEKFSTTQIVDENGHATVPDTNEVVPIKSYYGTTYSFAGWWKYDDSDDYKNPKSYEIMSEEDVINDKVTRNTRYYARYAVSAFDVTFYTLRADQLYNSSYYSSNKNMKNNLNKFQISATQTVNKDLYPSDPGITVPEVRGGTEDYNYEYVFAGWQQYEVKYKDGGAIDSLKAVGDITTDLSQSKVSTESIFVAQYTQNSFQVRFNHPKLKSGVIGIGSVTIRNYAEKPYSNGQLIADSRQEIKKGQYATAPTSGFETEYNYKALTHTDGLYVFDGWQIYDKGNKKMMDEVYSSAELAVLPIYGDTEFYAHYTRRDFGAELTVTFENFDGSVLGSNSVGYNTLVKDSGALPVSNPTRASSNGKKYTFSGWKVKDSNASKVYSADEIKEYNLNQTVTFVAQFEEDNIEVKFYYLNNEKYDPKFPNYYNTQVFGVVDSNGKLIEKAVPEPVEILDSTDEAKYKFMGWKKKGSTDETRYTKAQILAMTFDDTTEFVAVYEKMVMVTFNYTVGQTGKTHIGWGVKGEKLDETQWPTETPAPVDPEGLSLQAFKSWVYFGFGENGMFNADFTRDTILTNDSYNLIATYNVQHRVRFFEKDGTTQIGKDIYVDQYSFVTGAPAAKNPIDNGKEVLYFKGWKVGDTTYEDISKYSTDGKDSGITFATDFVADYTPTLKYTVEFKYAEDLNNGAKIGDTHYVIPGESIAAADVPTVEETIDIISFDSQYRFSGWKIEGSNDNTIYKDGAAIAAANLQITENTTFVATYATYYFVEIKDSFDDNDILKQGTIDTAWVEEGKTINDIEYTLPKPEIMANYLTPYYAPNDVKNDYYNAGWRLKGSTESFDYEKFKTEPITRHTVVCINWKLKPLITFEYDEDKNNNVTMRLMPGDVITAPTTEPADRIDEKDKSLYCFDYWKNKDTGEKLTSETKAQADATYVPVYKLKTAAHSVIFSEAKFNSDDITQENDSIKTEPVYVLEGYKLGAKEGNVPAEPAMKEQEGANPNGGISKQVFTGWKSSLDGKIYSADQIKEMTMGTEDIIFVAQYDLYHQLILKEGAPFGFETLADPFWVKDGTDFTIPMEYILGSNTRSLGEGDNEVVYDYLGWKNDGSTDNRIFGKEINEVTKSMSFSRVYEQKIKVIFQYELNGKKIEWSGGWVSQGNLFGNHLLPNNVDKTQIPTKESQNGCHFVFKNWKYNDGNTVKEFTGNERLYTTGDDYIIYVTPDFYKEFEVSFTYPTATYDGQKTTVTERVKEGEKLDISKVPSLTDIILDTAGKKYEAKGWKLGESVVTAATIADTQVKEAVTYEANYEAMVHLIFTYPVNGVNTTEERWIPQNSKLPQSQWPTAAPDKYYETVGEDNTAIEKTFEYWIGFEGIYATVTPDTTFTGETVHINAFYETAYKVEFYGEDGNQLGQTRYVIQKNYVTEIPTAAQTIEKDTETLTFDGWKVGDTPVNLAEYKIEAPTRFDANYSSVSKHAVTFSKWTDKYNGQKITSTVYVKPGEKVLAADIPSLPEEIEDADGNHYILKGWKAGEKTYNAAQIADEEVTAEVTYEAEYERMGEVFFEYEVKGVKKTLSKWVVKGNTLAKTEWPVETPTLVPDEEGKHYTFGIWTYADGVKVNEFTEATTITEDKTTVTPKFDASFDVTFKFYDKNGDAKEQTQEIADLAKVTNVPESKDIHVEDEIQYKWTGKYKSSLDDKVYTVAQIKDLNVGKAVTYTADYERMVKVSFEYEVNGESKVESDWIVKGDKYPESKWPTDTPTKGDSETEEFTYEYWIYDVSGTATKFTSEVTLDSDTVIKPYFATHRKPVVAFLDTEHNQLTDAQKANQYPKIGGKAAAPTLPETVLEDEDGQYTFTHWEASRGGQTVTFNPDMTFNEGEEITFYAKYSTIRKRTVIFQNDKGTSIVTSDRKLVGADIKDLIPATPVSEYAATDEDYDYFFLGWAESGSTITLTEAQLNALSVPDYASDTDTSDYVLVAVYDKQAKPVVKFKNGDGSIIEAATQKVSKGGNVESVPQATRESTTTIKFYHSGWKVEGSNDTKVYTSDEVKAYPINRDVVFVSEFDEEARPLITFTDRNTTVKSENIDKGTSIEAPADPATWEDNNGKYDFKEWKTSDGTVYSASLTFDSDTEFFAEYTTTNKYGVTFKAFDGNDYGEVQYILDGQPAKAPENPPLKPEDENGAYTFVGWHKEVIEPTPEQTRNFRRAALIMPTESYLTTDEVNVEPVSGITVYTPVYATTAKFDVKFMNYDGVTQIGETIRALDGTTVTPPTATRENTPTIEYTFAGWRVDGQGDVFTSEMVAQMVIEGDTTFVAVFDETEVLGEEFENPDDEEVLGEEFTNTNDESEVLGADFTATGDTAPLFIMIVSLMMSVIVIAGMSKRRKDI
jgi:hypothetical protein